VAANEVVAYEKHLAEIVHDDGLHGVCDGRICNTSSPS